MPKGVFRELVKGIAKDWRARFPWVAPVPVAYVPAMPKASTFHVGSANRFNLHLFLHLQHSSKPWAVGDLTVNVIFSSACGAPRRWIGRAGLEQDPEGSHRLGTLVYGNDKWWSLLPNGNRYGITWCPTSYSDSQRVVAEAVEDISTDLDVLFAMIHQRAG